MVRKQTCSRSHKMDKSLSQTLGSFVSHFQNTSDDRQCCHVRNTAQHYKVGLFQDVGLRLDGIPALDLWDVVIEVWHSSNDVPPVQNIFASKSKPHGAAGNCRHNTQTPGWRKKVTETLISCQIKIIWPQTVTLLRAKVQPSIFWRQRTCDKDDHQRNKSDDETRV